MLIRHLKIGEFAKRDSIAYKKSNLTICKMGNNIYMYFENGIKSTKVRKNSTAFLNNDFIKCDQYGNDIKKVEEMDYKTEFIVIDNKTNKAKHFYIEDDALDYIEELMETYPRAKFKLFKPYAAVAPQPSKVRKLLNFFK